MAEDIEDLLRHPAIWRPGDVSAGAVKALSSGFPALDAALPGSGWPRGAVTELHATGEGIGELGLLMPALGEVSKAGCWIIWIAPPHLPYAPAFADGSVDVSKMVVVRGAETRENLWAAEQALRAPACGVVVLWEGTHRFPIKSLRRLQLAAEAGGGLAMVFRNPQAGAAQSSAMLKLRIEPDPAGLAVTLLKCRGGASGRRLILDGATLNARCGSGLARDSFRSGRSESFDVE